MAEETTTTTGEETTDNTMGEEAREAQGAGPASSANPADEGPSTDELFEEVQRLATRFAQAVRTAWDSEERKQLETEVRKGLSALAEGVEEGFQKISEDERARTVVDQADEVMTSVGDTIRTSQVTNELASGLAKGLRKVSDTLSQWLEEQTPKETDVAGEEEERDIPIEER